MAINFGNNKTLSEVSGKLSAPGRIVQTIHTIKTGIVTTTSTTPITVMTSDAITLTNANNYVHIEFHSDVRTNDWGDTVWNLYYMRLVHVATSTVLAHTGYQGEYTNNIRHTHRSAIHLPGSVGPHQYRLDGWSYSANSTSFAYTGEADGIAYIRLTEIAV